MSNKSLKYNKYKKMKNKSENIIFRTFESEKNVTN
jgi:hypothetical protein